MPVRAIGDDDETAVVLAGAGVAAVVVVLAWAAEGLALADIGRHGSTLAHLVKHYPSQSVRADGAAMQQPKVPKQMPKQGDGAVG